MKKYTYDFDARMANLMYAFDAQEAAHRAGFLCPAEVRMARMRHRDDGFREARVTYRGFKARGTSKPINGDVDRPCDGERLAIAKAVRNLQRKILKHVGMTPPVKKDAKRIDFSSMPGFALFGIIP
jgi:hypothetical protein